MRAGGDVRTQQQLGPHEPTLRGAAICEDQFLQHVPELKRLVPLTPRLLQNGERGQDACFVGDHCTQLKPHGFVGDPATRKDQHVQCLSWLKLFSRHTGAVVSVHIPVQVTEVQLRVVDTV